MMKQLEEAREKIGGNINEYTETAKISECNWSDIKDLINNSIPLSDEKYEILDYIDKQINNNIEWLEDELREFNAQLSILNDAENIIKEMRR